MMEMNGLYLVLATSLFFTIIGVIYSKRQRLDAESYVSGRNSLKFWPLSATLFASGAGAWVLFGPAETAVSAGVLGLLGYALGSALSLAVFYWIGSRIRKLMPKGHSLTEYVLHRFGKWMYLLILLISVFFMGIALAAELTGIALAGKIAFGLKLGATAAIVGIGTMAYTALGGFKASVFTDKIQAAFIIPLLLLIFISGFFLVGDFDIGSSLKSNLGWNLAGFEFALTLIIGVVGAEMFDQMWWQRAYAGKDDKAMKRAYIFTGIAIALVVLLAGLFGFFALGFDAASDPSAAMFSFLMLKAPLWIIYSAMVLGIALIMSTMDSLLNAIASVLTIDFIRIKPKASKKTVMNFAYIVTVVIALIAIFIATKGYSVLYLFLLADLLCVAAVFPVFFGMWNARITGRAALLASLAGLAAGLYFFPSPDYSNGNLLYSFLAALIVPSVISAILARSRKGFDFNKLRENVNEF